MVLEYLYCCKFKLSASLNTEKKLTTLPDHLWYSLSLLCCLSFNLWGPPRLVSRLSRPSFRRNRSRHNDSNRDRAPSPPNRQLAQERPRNRTRTSRSICQRHLLCIFPMPNRPTLVFMDFGAYYYSLDLAYFGGNPVWCG